MSKIETDPGVNDSKTDIFVEKILNPRMLASSLFGGYNSPGALKPGTLIGYDVPYKMSDDSVAFEMRTVWSRVTVCLGVSKLSGRMYAVENIHTGEDGYVGSTLIHTIMPEGY